AAVPVRRRDRKQSTDDPGLSALAGRSRIDVPGRTGTDAAHADPARQQRPVLPARLGQVAEGARTGRQVGRRTGERPQCAACPTTPRTSPTPTTCGARWRRCPPANGSFWSCATTRTWTTRRSPTCSASNRPPYARPRAEHSPRYGKPETQTCR